LTRQKGISYQISNAYRGERLGQGRDNTRLFIRENKDILREIEEAVREKLGLKPKDVGPKDTG